MEKLLRSLYRLPIFILIVFTLSLNSAFADYNTAKVVRHLGKQIPLNLTFVNSKGEKVQLKELINKPTILDFCYYHCAGICSPLMAEIANTIGKVKYKPGKDYNIISISIDQNETPKIAADKKHAMMGLVSIKIPDSSWTFLTGDSASIYQLTDVAGFQFKRSYNGFLHKGVLIFVDKTGKITRYMNPNYTRKGDFQILTAGFESAIEDASKGEVKSTIANVLKTCYTFIPKGKDLIVLMLVLATGLITLVSVIFIIKKVKLSKS